MPINSKAEELTTITIRVPTRDYELMQSIGRKHKNTGAKEICKAITTHIESHNDSRALTASQIMEQRINQATHDNIAFRDAYKNGK